MTQELCPKTIHIYHIPTQKVGSSCNLKERMSSQGYNLDDCEVLHTIEPDTMTYRDIWELEQQEASERGYFVENESHYQQFLRQHTNNTSKDPAVRAKMSSTRSDGRYDGKNNPMFGKTGKNHHKAKVANIYCANTNETIAEGINIGEWSRLNGFNNDCLSRTARADRSKPSTATNRHHHKGIYARYITAEVSENV